MLLHPSPPRPQITDTEKCPVAPQGLGPLPSTPRRWGSALAPPDNRHGWARGTPKSSEARAREGLDPQAAPGGPAGRRLSRSQGRNWRAAPPATPPRALGGGEQRPLAAPSAWEGAPAAAKGRAVLIPQRGLATPPSTGRHGERGCAGLGWAGRGIHGRATMETARKITASGTEAALSSHLSRGSGLRSVLRTC